MIGYTFIGKIQTYRYEITNGCIGLDQISIQKLRMKFWRGILLLSFPETSKDVVLIGGGYNRVGV